MFLKNLIAMFLLAATAANAGLIVYTTPDTTYRNRTTQIALAPPAYQETGAYSSIGDGQLSIDFQRFNGSFFVTHQMFLYTAGPSSGWPAGWGDVPATEGYTPDASPQVLYTDFGFSNIGMWFSRPVRTFGFELQPDRMPGGPYVFRALFFGGNRILGAIDLTFGDVNGNTPITTQLVAATSTDYLIEGVVIDGYDDWTLEPVEWAGARFRYELDTAATPEPATWVLIPLGGVLLALAGCYDRRTNGIPPDPCRPHSARTSPALPSRSV